MVVTKAQSLQIGISCADLAEDREHRQGALRRMRLRLSEISLVSPSRIPEVRGHLARCGGNAFVVSGGGYLQTLCCGVVELGNWPHVQSGHERSGMHR